MNDIFVDNRQLNIDGKQFTVHTEIDVADLTKWLAWRAARNKSKKSIALNGVVKVTVRQDDAHL